VLASVSAGLALLFLLGRLLLPTSVFLRGSITEARTGKLVPGAELWLVNGGNWKKAAAPQARSGDDGSYTLYVGWYRAGDTLRITAPGYSTMDVPLGPRAVGMRSIRRSFELYPETPHGGDGHICNLSCCPSVVVSTFPEAGAVDVDPNLKEIRATFSVDMLPGSWAWVKVDEQTWPETSSQPRYLSDNRTCVLPVTLKPGRTYTIWLNVDQFTGFRDVNGVPSVPYLLVFKTRGKI
jgi:hypothetical protein